MTFARRFGVLTALTLTLILSACSTTPEAQLVPQFGTSGIDAGIDVRVDSSGRVFVLSDVSNDGEYSQIRRFDNTGRVIWTKDVYDAQGCYMSDRIDEIETDAKGNVYIGYVDYGCEYQPRYIKKFNASGTYVSTFEIDFDAANPFSFAVDANGSIYVAGDEYLSKYPSSGTSWTTKTYVEALGKLPTLKVASNGYIFVAGPNGVSRYTSNGTLSWTKSFAWSKPELGFDIATSGSNVYIRNTTTIRKLDATGKQLWVKTQGGLNVLGIGDMTADAAGNVYLTGKYSATSSNRDAFVRKLNTSGTVLWTKTYGTSSYDDGRAIATVNGSDIYVTGQTQGNLTGNYKGGQGDGYLRRLNSSGNPYWTR